MSIRSEAIMSVRGHRGRASERLNLSQRIRLFTDRRAFQPNPASSLRNYLVSQNFASWKQIASWLRALTALRDAA